MSKWPELISYLANYHTLIHILLLQSLFSSFIDYSLLFRQNDPLTVSQVDCSQSPCGCQHQSLQISTYFGPCHLSDRICSHSPFTHPLGLWPRCHSSHTHSRFISHHFPGWKGFPMWVILLPSGTWLNVIIWEKPPTIDLRNPFRLFLLLIFCSTE